VFAAVADRYPDCKARHLDMKGKESPISAWSLPLP
jgi:hypothetical protein